MDWISSVTWPQWFGYAAVLASIVTCAMKTMIPLRLVSMVCNSLFITYGIFANVYPTLILNCILLPLNGLRLFQMRKLIADVERAAASGQSSIDWLIPYMSHRKLKKGEIVFRKGDVADAMFYSVSGRYRLLESGMEIPFGQVFGELVDRVAQGGWPGAHCELPDDQGALLSESGVRVLLPAPHQRAAVPEHQPAGGRTGAQGRAACGACAEAGVVEPAAIAWAR